MSVSSLFRPSLTLGLLLGSLLLVASGCTDDTDDLSLKHQDTITVDESVQGLYPEGVQFDAQNNTFLAGSQTRNTIGRVQDDGIYRVFIRDTSLISSVGLSLDPTRDRLLVAVSDPGYNTALSKTRTKGKLARVVIFNSNTGIRVQDGYLNLSDQFRKGGPHFANDIALDNAGTAYVTDSFSPVIYRINSQNRVTIFAKGDTLLAPSAADVFGMNGIVHKSTSDGNYLLVIKSDTGTLLKIEVKGEVAGAISQVAVDQDLSGGDGMLFQDSTLLVVSNKQNKVFRLYSTDNWKSATNLGTFSALPNNAYPTTLARRTAFEAYVLYSGLNSLQNNQTPPTGFTIQKVKF
ncbi:hypothetical protein [Hymenobacter cavernae]|uniref:Gluconolaconase n=1 Tax=Hymenobacter cavernae TaxID=2044852 RepID=A0ABQ1UPJ6_9BACT|nr:hypothetical protein [Hymenobacter cavernae]GGF24040.1 gluconolaconase [Hymenobacter cavernae]